jgi:hypothetical protein
MLKILVVSFILDFCVGCNSNDSENISEAFYSMSDCIVEDSKLMMKKLDSASDEIIVELGDHYFNLILPKYSNSCEADFSFPYSIEEGNLYINTKKGNEQAKCICDRLLSLIIEENFTKIDSIFFDGVQIDFIVRE